MFKLKFDIFEQDINCKIEEINQYLCEIDYNFGWFICILKELVYSEDISIFK